MSEDPLLEINRSLGPDILMVMSSQLRTRSGWDHLISRAAPSTFVSNSSSILAWANTSTLYNGDTWKFICPHTETRSPSKPVLFLISEMMGPGPLIFSQEENDNTLMRAKTADRFFS